MIISNFCYCYSKIMPFCWANPTSFFAMVSAWISGEIPMFHGFIPCVAWSKCINIPMFRMCFMLFWCQNPSIFLQNPAETPPPVGKATPPSPLRPPRPRHFLAVSHLPGGHHDGCLRAVAPWLPLLLSLLAGSVQKEVPTVRIFVVIHMENG